MSLDPQVKKTGPTPVTRLAYDLSEVAQALGISYISVFRLVQRGKLKTILVLRKHLVPVRELERFLKEAA